MTNTLHANSTLSQRVLTIVAILFSGICWYFSTGLSGDFWYLLWIAPVPVLMISFISSKRKTFFISFLAYLIGRLSWFSYLITVLTVVPAIIFTILLPLIFTQIVIFSRSVVIKSNSWWAVFAFPVFFTSFEFLVFKLSTDGTAGSIAYSQSNFLPLIQIASVTGIIGITFLVSFIASAIAVGWYFRRQKTTFRYLTVAAVVIVASAFVFGITRISSGSENGTVKVGIVVLDEQSHNITDHPDFQKEKLVTVNYIKEIAPLAASGAELIVLPERAINLDKETGDSIINMLGNAARQNHVFIITGYTNFRNNPERNSALVINKEGNVAVDYNKVHLVKGFEKQFTPGKLPGFFKLNGVQLGIAICKDLDFPDYIREYGLDSISFLTIPAWDFVKDDWLHSRMAILRGVENGFSEVRAARLGRLTISDCFGRVGYEANSSKGSLATLRGEVSLQNRTTLYSHFPNWFGIANLIAAIFFILFAGRKRKVKTSL